MTTPAAGWYPDPQNASMKRYWDGSAWTEHVTHFNSGSADSPSYTLRTGNNGFNTTGSTIAGNTTNFNSNTLWKFEGSTNFLLVVNDQSGDEETVFGG